MNNNAGLKLKVAIFVVVLGLMLTILAWPRSDINLMTGATESFSFISPWFMLLTLPIMFAGAYFFYKVFIELKKSGLGLWDIFSILVSKEVRSTK